MERSWKTGISSKLSVNVNGIECERVHTFVFGEVNIITVCVSVSNRSSANIFLLHKITNQIFRIFHNAFSVVLIRTICNVATRVLRRRPIFSIGHHQQPPGIVSGFATIIQRLAVSVRTDDQLGISVAASAREAAILVHCTDRNGNQQCATAAFDA